MARLLRPGLHSGTLPKLFGRLRRAERRARLRGDWSPVRKHLQSLVGVEHAIREFVDRELVTLLAKSDGWKRVPLRVGQVRLATNRVVAELASPEWTIGGMGLVFELRSGRLVADRVGTDWTLLFRPEEKTPWDTALLGLLKTAGVEDVSWPLRQSLVLMLDRSDFAAEPGLPGAGLAGQIDQLRQGWPLGEVAVSWRQWVEVWSDRPALSLADPACPRP
jgi:hypothetical protein